MPPKNSNQTKRKSKSKAKSSSPEPKTPQERKSRTMWDSDSFNGGPTSIDVLLDWLTTEGNYSRYKGGSSQKGESKTVLCSGIVGELINVGIVGRKAEHVREKIGKLEASFKVASDWLAQTGQGVSDEKQISDALISRCAYYYQLEPIMADRASTRPLCTSDPNVATKSDEHDSDDSSTSEETYNKRQRTSSSNSKGKGVMSEWESIQSECRMMKEKEIDQKWELDSKRLELEVQREAREAQQEMRAQKEADVNLRILESKAKEAELAAKVATLKARKELKDAGISDAEIDAALGM
jgi:hypothetical protein